jgi:hypothetical protein
MVGFATFTGRGNYLAAGTFYSYTYGAGPAVLYYENGSFVGQTTGLVAGDVIRVERTAANQIKYFRNGNLLYTSVATIPTSTLYASADILTPGGKVKTAMVNSYVVNTQEWRDNAGTLRSRVKGDGRWRHDGATTYDDLRIEPTVRSTGARAPSFEQWFTDGAGSQGLYLYSFDDAAAGSEKEIFFQMQMPHNWKEGTAIQIHIHWIGNTDDTTSQPRFGLEYTWADIGQVFGNSTIVYDTQGNIDGSGSSDTNITAFKHYINHFAAITPSATQNNISSILIGRIFRNSSDAGDTYNVAGNKCGLLYIDAHYEIDSFGSDTAYTKD